ncbi:MAG: ion transporter [Oscillospiraceae bacterium]|nr:ion transporter [Oscillospiraceae bacterium]
MREKIYQMVHRYERNALSVAYKWFMIVVIAVSLLPLTTKETTPAFAVIDMVCLVIYSIDFFLRWISADYKFGVHSWTSFARYPFRLISIIDLLSIFALLCPLIGWSQAVVLKVFRIVRIFRYSKTTRTILEILKRSKKALLAVGSLAVGYILLSALVVFNAEPQTFATFFDAVYWATVSLTTVGYGDLYPVTVVGRIVAMTSSFFGIAVVALPAGVVTAEYMKSLQEKE